SRKLNAILRYIDDNGPLNRIYKEDVEHIGNDLKNGAERLHIAHQKYLDSLNLNVPQQLKGVNEVGKVLQEFNDTFSTSGIDQLLHLSNTFSSYARNINESYFDGE